MSWAQYRLDELGQVSRGRSRHRPRDAAHLYGGPYPFIQTGDVKHSGLYLTHYEQTYSEEGLAQSKLWPVGTLCITIAANIADTSILGIEACFPDSIIGFIPDRGKADARFIKYLFDAALKKKYSAFTQGAAQDNLSQAKLLSLKLPVPDLSKQQIIADILSSYDDLIENNKRRIELLEESARQLYKEWFVRFRFPGHEHVKIIDGFPEGWQTRALSDCISILETGNRPKGGVSNIEEGVPSIGAESIVSAGIFDFSKTKYVPEMYFSKLNKGVVEDKDVLIYKDGGRPGHFTPHVSMFGDGFPYTSMALNSHVYRVRGRDKYTQEFLYFHLSAEHIMLWMNKAGSGAAIPGIARKDLLRLPVISPPKYLIDSFTETASLAINQILKLAKQARKLEEARDFLLPKLMSGEFAV